MHRLVWSHVLGGGMGLWVGFYRGQDGSRTARRVPGGSKKKPEVEHSGGARTRCVVFIST